VEINSVSFSWMLIGEGPITNDVNNNRVSISPTTTNGSDFTSILQFDYIAEEDDGIYVCTIMILETDVSEFVEIENFHGECMTHTNSLYMYRYIKQNARLAPCVMACIE